ncbi:gamma-mobile-trio protein GmtX [Chromobacterium haemolyticum]|uniref:gamma-mobile-trio protein GmtX n=1 Tax=Chromobacterium haemolyticum TaxID=394935 RepID=UPI0006932CCF|nr:gamma-mobile-trio protein GmtX [Chromobacterium haemolyticum]
MSNTPNELIEQLCQLASPRKAQSLRLILTICVEQTQRGSSDFSVATIGRLSAERGGPSAAAIRNKPGEDYRALIKTYAASVNGQDRKKREPAPSEAEALLEGVNDPVLKVRVKLLLAEMESLRAQLLAARHLANKTAVLELGLDSGEHVPHAHADGLFLSLQEVTALEAAISPATLEHWGWSIDQAGRVLTETSQVVFRAGFVTAIRKTVQHVADF